MRSHEGVCYPENEDAIYKQKIRIFYAQTYTKACSTVGYFIGGLRTRAEGQRKFLNLESLKCHFLVFGEVLTDF
jgi:hypothetical protein